MTEMISPTPLSIGNRTVLVWSGVLGLGVCGWGISVGDLIAGGKLGSMGYVCAIVGMLLVIAMVTALSRLANRRLFHPKSRNTAHPVLVASLVVVGWYIALAAVAGILAAVVGLNGDDGVDTSTWIAWLVGGVVAIVGCVVAWRFADRR
jgi:hypothetical protein